MSCKCGTCWVHIGVNSSSGSYGKCKVANVNGYTFVVVAGSMVLEVRLKGLIHVQRSSRNKQCAGQTACRWRLKYFQLWRFGVANLRDV